MGDLVWLVKPQRNELEGIRQNYLLELPDNSAAYPTRVPDEECWFAWIQLIPLGS